MHHLYSVVTLSWSPSNSSRYDACVPVVPFTPRNLSSFLTRSALPRSSSRSCIHRHARLPTVVSWAGLDTHTHTHTDRHTYKQTDSSRSCIQTRALAERGQLSWPRHLDTHTHTHTYTYRQTDIHTHRQTDIQTYRETDSSRSCIHRHARLPTVVS